MLSIESLSQFSLAVNHTPWKTATAEQITETVIENLMSNGIAIYETAKKYMGTEMLKSCENVSQYLDIADSQ